MKKWISLVLLFSSLFVSLSGKAQYNLNQYSFQRSLEAQGEGWTRFELTPDMPGKMQVDLRDFRIYGLSEEKDTIRVPFIFDVQKPKLRLEMKKLKVYNKEQNKTDFSVILELTEGEIYNRIDLQIENENFDWMVQVEGSNDLKNWVKRNEAKRILAIKQEGTDFHLSKLNFDDSRYTYLRLSIPADEEVQFKNAIVWEQRKSVVDWRALNHEDRFDYSKAENESVINSKLDHNSPVSQIQLRGSSPNDFYREVIVEYLADSIVLEERVDYVYREVRRFSWASGDDGLFDIPTTYAQTWRIRIPHLDNEPIDIDSVEFKAYAYYVLARLPNADAFRVIYGSPTSGKANFDLLKVKEEITEELKYASLSEESMIPKRQVVQQKPLFENQAWMWTVLIALTLFLSYFGFRMMKSA